LTRAIEPFCKKINPVAELRKISAIACHSTGSLKPDVSEEVVGLSDGIFAPDQIYKELGKHVLQRAKCIGRRKACSYANKWTIGIRL
jgi:hypothetical protein